MEHKNKKLHRRSVMKNNFWLLRRIWKYTPGYMIWMIIEGVVWGVRHSIDILYVQRLFYELEQGAEFADIARVIISYGVYLVVFYLFHNWYWKLYNPQIREKLHIAMHSDMFKQAVRIDIANYDDPKFYNDYVWAMDESYSHAKGLMEDTGKLINRIVASVTVTGVLISVDITMAGIVFVVLAIRIVFGYCKNRVGLKYRDILIPVERKDKYIKRVFMLPDYAKELRITHVSDNLIEEYNQNVRIKKEIIMKNGMKMAGLEFAINAVQYVGEIGCMILILYKVMVAKTVGLGGFAATINAIWKLSWQMQDMFDRLLKYHEHGIYIEKMIHFMECEPKITDGTLEAQPFDSLKINGLTFRYNVDKEDVCALDNVNLEIRRGEKIAIVGYNGAGKTTLTKLLMRLYDPSAGEILYNGRSLKEYTIESLRKRVAAVFQDYRIFASSVAENVVGGEYEGSMKDEVIEALEKSTLKDKIETLPEGIHTPLTREFDKSGTQLSGGEQQKIAIARAFYKDADLIILDEPSSALDPDAEYALNQSIAAYAGQKTVIFISHRLSTTRHADRIYMFDGGRIIENGTHEELMAADGKYAYMFNLQAEKYRNL